MTQPAIFLDRDGVINHNRVDHVKSWSEFDFLPGALEALRYLAHLNWPIVVVTNQAIIGRRIVAAQVVDDINRQMAHAIHQAGGRIDAVFHCPHRPEDGCMCRKPMPGLLFEAAEKLDLDLSASYMVGDASTDVLAARSAGCKPVLVRSGRGEEQLANMLGEAYQGLHVTANLGEAATWIRGQI